MMSPVARRLLLCGVMLATVPVLQACLPVVATGVVGAVLLSNDRRSTGVLVDDETIENRIGDRFEETFADRIHANVNSYNHIVLLTGEAATLEIKQRAEQLARTVEGVRGVHNELVVGPPSGTQARINDGYITSKVKARFVDANKFSPVVVRVTTENRVVYLQGMVTRQEAADAAQVAAQTSDVFKVVTLFEIIPDQPKAKPAPKDRSGVDPTQRTMEGNGV